MDVKLLESLFCDSKISNNMFGGENDKENATLLKIVIIILILFVGYNYFENKNKQKQPEQKIVTVTEKIIVPEQHVGRIGNVGNIYPALRDYDYRTYNDDLTPPRKRDDYNIPANVFYPDRFGLYTKGGPNPFKKMGFLNNKNAQPGDPYKFLTLMGRQKYYNSNTYEYYVVSTNRDENIKFDLDKNREIFSGDAVKVPQLDDVEYEATIDKIVEYEYNPFVM